MIDLAALCPQLLDPTSGDNRDLWSEPSREGSSEASLSGSEHGPSQEPGWASETLVPSFLPKSLVNCCYDLFCLHKSKNPRNLWVSRVVGDWEVRRPTCHQPAGKTAQPGFGFSVRDSFCFIMLGSRKMNLQALQSSNTAFYLQYLAKL